MILSEHLNNFEQGLINEKKTTDNFDKSNPVYKFLLEKADKVDTRLCKTNLEKTSLYENALKEALQNEYPDKHWSEVTGCDIRTTLLESGNDIDKTARRIVESLKVKQEKETVKKETGALKENMRKKSLKEAKSLEEDTPKDLLQGIKNNMNYQGGKYGRKLANGTNIDFNASDAIEVTPEEIMRMKKNGEPLDNIFIVSSPKRGKPSVTQLDSEGHPNEYGQVRSWGRRKNQSLKSVLDDAESNKDWGRDVKYYKYNYKVSGQTHPERFGRESDYWGNDYKRLSNLALGASRRKGTEDHPEEYTDFDSPANARYYDSNKKLQEPLEKFNELKNKLNSAKHSIYSYTQKLKGAKARGGSNYDFQKAEFLKNKIAELQAQLDEVQAKLSSDQGQKEISDLRNTVNDYRSQYNDIQVELDRLLRRGISVDKLLPPTTESLQERQFSKSWNPSKKRVHKKLSRTDADILATKSMLTDKKLGYDAPVSTYDRMSDKLSGEPSRGLSEATEWKYTLSCSDDLESAIDGGDLEEVIEALKGAYDELVDQELLDEGRRDKVFSALEQIDVYDDGAESKVEKKLDQFYNVCDKLGVKISFNESLDETWAELCDGKPTSFYNNERDARNGAFWSKFGDAQYGMGNHSYDVKEVEGDPELEKALDRYNKTGYIGESLLTEGKLEIPTVTNNNNDKVRKAIQTVYAQVKDLTDKVNGKLKKVDEKKLDKVKAFCDKKVRNKYYEIFMDAFQIYPVSRKLLLKYLSDGLKSADSVKAFRQFFESIKQKFYGFAQNIDLDSISRYDDGAGEEDMLHNNSRMKQNAGANSKNAIDKYFAKALGFDMDESLKEGKSLKEKYPPKNVTFTASEVQLDSDDEADDDEIISEILSDLLSDTYGYCHNGFNYEVKKNEFGEPSEFICTDIDWDLSESLKEDTVKQGSHWVNKGKEGTHGKFKTKKGADAQRKAMFANGYKESLKRTGKRALKEYYEDYTDVNTLAKAIEDAYKDLRSSDDGGCYTFKLNDRLAVCVGWQDGYDTPDGYDIVAGLKVWTSDDMRTDYEWINSPFYRGGDVWDTTTTIGKGDGKSIAPWLLKEYEEMKNLPMTEQGEIIEVPEQVVYSKSELDDLISRNSVGNYDFDLQWEIGNKLEDDYGLEPEDFDYEIKGNDVIVSNISWELNESKSSRKGKKLTEAPIYDLRPQYDSRKSFYGKAKVDTGYKNNENKLYSYGTLVAEIKDGKPVVYGTYSATTLRHIKDWLRQNGFKADSARQIMADYGTKDESLKEGKKINIYKNGDYAYSTNKFSRVKDAVADARKSGKVKVASIPDKEVEFSDEDKVTGKFVRESCKAKKDKKPLTEGTSNFWSMDYFPLLVFGDYESAWEYADQQARDEIESDYDNMTDEEIEAYEEDAFNDPRYENLLDKAFDEYFDYCLLDEEEFDSLKDDIDSFNDRMKKKYYYSDEISGTNSLDGEEWDGVYPSVEIKPGYYEAEQLYVNVEPKHDVIQNYKFFMQEQVDEVNKFLEEMKKKYGLTELGVAYRFDNGETGYSKK